MPTFARIRGHTSITGTFRNATVSSRRRRRWHAAFRRHRKRRISLRTPNCVSGATVLNYFRVPHLIAKPTGSKLVKGPAESGEICSVEVEEK